MSDCPFCKIVDGEIPSTPVLNTDYFYAFMDINPQAPGHVQVIPKLHYRFVWDVPDIDASNPNIGEYFSTVRTIANAIRGTFGTDYCFCKIMGDEVAHAHVWLFPHPQEAEGEKDALEENAQKIRQQLGASE